MKNEKMTRVTKDEFFAWVEAYPRKLVFDVTGIVEPPEASYNDLTLGSWPESVVASYSKFDDDDPYYKQAGDTDHCWRVRADLMALPQGAQS